MALILLQKFLIVDVDMYLKQAVIENNGPLKKFSLNLNFTDNGLPKPLILVGGNGSGKTNFLSLVADALFEAAAVHYDNVLPKKGMNRAWFRVVGGKTISLGAPGSYSLLRFDDQGKQRFYKEKAGLIASSSVASKIPVEFQAQLNWPDDGPIKTFGIDDNDSRRLFEKEVYAYFPTSRSEVPYWLNREALVETEFDVAPNFVKRLSKPIYIEHALDKLKQWLIGVLSDVRTETSFTQTPQGTQWTLSGDPRLALMSSPLAELCNKLLQAVLCDEKMKFVWLGRKSNDKIGIARENTLAFPNLDALSTGQAILLGMFGSLLRYGDLSQDGLNIELSSIHGICLIDEIDAHMHVELQHKVIPNLIKMFPSIQFILTSHSPLFVLGMEKVFGSDGIQVIDMPNGLPVGAEAYSEFGKALDVLAASHAFTELVVEEARQGSKPIVYVEGETDAPYICRAAELLGEGDILGQCDIEWIGSKDEKGQGFHTGKDALKHTLSVLKANPALITRPVLLLYDNDSTTPDEDYGIFSVRTIPVNENNNIVRVGIENLLSEESIGREFYQEKEKKKPNGEELVTRTLRKSDLCKKICKDGNIDNFKGFAKTIDIIKNFLSIHL